MCAQPAQAQQGANGDLDFDFDEEWYLRQYPDVARGVARGHGSAKDHYRRHGRAEGRLPLPPPDYKPPGQRLENVSTQASSASPAVQSELASATFLGRPQNIDASLPAVFPKHNGAAYLNPTSLSKTELVPRRVALIGACFLEVLGFHRDNPSGCPVDLMIINNAADMPALNGSEIEVQSYDVAVIQIPLRVVYLDTTLTAFDYDSVDAYQSAFEQACQRLEFHLRARMEWNRKHGC